MATLVTTAKTPSRPTARQEMNGNIYKVMLLGHEKTKQQIVSFATSRTGLQGILIRAIGQTAQDKSRAMSPIRGI